MAKLLSVRATNLSVLSGECRALVIMSDNNIEYELALSDSYLYSVLFCPEHLVNPSSVFIRAPFKEFGTCGPGSGNNVVFLFLRRDLEIRINRQELVEEYALGLLQG